MARILLIEDDPIVLSIVARMIEYGGHEVLIGHYGQDAVAAIKGMEFDLLVTDIAMPEVSGWGVIALLREVKPDVPVIAISGGGLGFMPEAALGVSLKLGADAALAKPFDGDQLMETIERVLRAANARAASGG